MYAKELKNHHCPHPIQQVKEFKNVYTHIYIKWHMKDICINITTFYIEANEMNNELALLDPVK